VLLDSGGVVCSEDAPIDASSLRDVTMLSAGAAHVCALSHGNVYCGGDGGGGVLGLGDMESRKVPALVTLAARPVAVHAGWISTCAKLADGSFQCWGEQDLFELHTKDSEYCGFLKDNVCTLSPSIVTF
jgi:hypothetical protein